MGLLPVPSMNCSDVAFFKSYFIFIFIALFINTENK